jgi:AcrR family transcriptional regulator
MGRPALSDRHLAERRERIFAAALDIFRRDGAAGVTMRALGEAVGLSPMALYRYVPAGKAGVLATLRCRGFDALAAAFVTAAAGERHPVSRVLALCQAIVRFAAERPDLYRLMFEVTQPELETVAGEEIALARQRAWAPALEAFGAAVGQGMLRGDPQLLPHVFFAGIHGVIEFELSRQSDPHRNVDRLMRPMLRTLLAGCGATPAALRRVESLDW